MMVELGAILEQRPSGMTVAASPLAIPPSGGTVVASPLSLSNPPSLPVRTDFNAARTKPPSNTNKRALLAIGGAILALAALGVGLSAMSSNATKKHIADDSESEASPSRSSPAPAAARASETGEPALTPSGTFQKHCRACHSDDGTTASARTLKGVFGTVVPAPQGASVVADENYFRQAIGEHKSRCPNAPGSCPDFRALGSGEVDDLVMYIRSLGTTASAPASAPAAPSGQPTGTPTKTAAPARSDPPRPAPAPPPPRAPDKAGSLKSRPIGSLSNAELSELIALCQQQADHACASRASAERARRRRAEATPTGI